MECIKVGNHEVVKDLCWAHDEVRRLTLTEKELYLENPLLVEHLSNAVQTMHIINIDGTYS